MQRIATTVLGLVGSPDWSRLRELRGRLGGERANVRAVLPEAGEPALDRAVAAWREPAGVNLPFIVHDADPLAAVAAACADRWDGGLLEIAVWGRVRSPTPTATRPRPSRPRQGRDYLTNPALVRAA